MRERQEDSARAPSKSQRKREHRELQALALALLALPEAKLRSLPLAERTRDELHVARGMPPSGARNRQLRLLAKLLESEDIEALQRPGAESARAQRAATARQHHAERLRERLLEGNDETLAGLAGELPETVCARLRELVALARDPLAGQRARHAYREIFRLLLDEAQDPSGT